MVPYAFGIGIVITGRADDRYILRKYVIVRPH